MGKKISLDEWLQLLPEQRDEIKKQWKQNWNEWAYLLDEAIESFKQEYKKIQEISDVQPSYECEPVHPSFSVSRLVTEPYISVKTTLKNKEETLRLPPEYCYFKVVQEPWGDTSQEYLEEWKLLLKKLLKWTEEETVAWAQEHHAEDLKGKNIWFDHEYPCYYIVHLFVPKDKIMMVARIGESKFLGKIQRAIYSPDENLFSPNYDWDAARQRVNDVLREIDASLPE